MLLLLRSIYSVLCVACVSMCAYTIGSSRFHPQNTLAHECMYTVLVRQRYQGNILAHIQQLVLTLSAASSTTFFSSVALPLVKPMSVLNISTIL
jgi:hypothetical protein